MVGGGEQRMAVGGGEQRLAVGGWRLVLLKGRSFAKKGKSQASQGPPWRGVEMQGGSGIWRGRVGAPPTRARSGVPFALPTPAPSQPPHGHTSEALAAVMQSLATPYLATAAMAAMSQQFPRAP